MGGGARGSRGRGWGSAAHSDGQGQREIRPWGSKFDGDRGLRAQPQDLPSETQRPNSPAGRAKLPGAAVSRAFWCPGRELGGQCRSAPGTHLLSSSDEHPTRDSHPGGSSVICSRFVRPTACGLCAARVGFECRLTQIVNLLNTGRDLSVTFFFVSSSAVMSEAPRGATRLDTPALQAPLLLRSPRAAPTTSTCLLGKPPREAACLGERRHPAAACGWGDGRGPGLHRGTCLAGTRMCPR